MTPGQLMVSRFYKHALVQDANSLTIKCSKCDFRIDPRILLFGGEQAITKILDSFGKCGAAKMADAFELHEHALEEYGPPIWDDDGAAYACHACGDPTRGALCAGCTEVIEA